VPKGSFEMSLISILSFARVLTDKFLSRFSLESADNLFCYEVDELVPPRQKKEAASLVDVCVCVFYLLMRLCQWIH
jgi:hypothetical protein